MTDDDAMERARNEMRGPLGRELSRFALRYATSGLISTYDTDPAHPSKLSNGTITLVEVSKRRFGITCDHVIGEYQRRLQGPGNTVFQVGGLRMEPLDKVVHRDASVDVVVLDLDDLPVDEICVHHQIGSSFYSIRRWPPQLPSEGGFASFGGFPAEWRNQVDLLEFEFPTLGCGAMEVVSVCEDRITLKAAESDLVLTEDSLTDSAAVDYGGLSGCPVFNMERSLPLPHLIGVGYEVMQQFDDLIVMYVRPLTCLQGFSGFGEQLAGLEGTGFR